MTFFEIENLSKIIKYDFPLHIDKYESEDYFSDLLL